MQTAKQLIADFIEQIWNQQNFEQLDRFLHPDFKDHSLPPALPADKTGLVAWIEATGRSFEHTTLIDEQVADGEKIMIKIRMRLKHVGEWRGLLPTGTELEATGYRFYKLAGGKIAEQWALIDGQTIENRLKQSGHGCKVGE